MKQTATFDMVTLDSWERKAINAMPQHRRDKVLGFLLALQDAGVNHLTSANYVCAIKTLNGGKHYDQLTEADIRTWAREIDEKYNPTTAWGYKAGVRKFIKYASTGKIEGGKLPRSVAWLKRGAKKTRYKFDILTCDEVKKIAAAADNQRDCALIFCLYESGCRVSEFANIRLRDLEFDSFGAVLRVGGEVGKTGSRRVRLFDSIPDLQLWLAKHPDRENPESYLWYNFKRKTKPLTRRSLARIVKTCARPLVNKKVYPHILRHSRATHLATVFKESQMREYFGWSKDSDMPSTYVHLSGRDVDETLFEHYGLKVKAEPSENPLAKKVCPKCSAPNSALAKFCWRCWQAFDSTRAEEIMRIILDGLAAEEPDALQRVIDRRKGLAQEIGTIKSGKEEAAVKP